MGSAAPGAIPYPRQAVSTRKLIVVALLCGLAILVAGGIQLFRISDADDRTVEVLAEGEAATVGSITVVVEDSSFDDAVIRAAVRMSLAVSNTALSITCPAMKNSAVSAMRNIRKKKIGAMMAKSTATAPRSSRRNLLARSANRRDWVE